MIIGKERYLLWQDPAVAQEEADFPVAAEEAVEDFPAEAQEEADLAEAEARIITIIITAVGFFVQDVITAAITVARGALADFLESF